MTHPSSLDLEAFACGEGPRASITEHLATCADCEAYVGRLGSLVATRPSAAEAEARIARALSRADVDGRRTSVVGARRAAETRTRANGRLWRVTGSAFAPLAAAAAIVLLLRSGGVKAIPTPDGPGPGPSPTATAPDRIQMAPLSEPETSFKGGRQLAVVRERAGGQARFAASVGVRPGDRLRVEVALDREQTILGAVLADDGSYLELMPLAVRGPGTHFSEKSAKIDATPTYGTIVIGTREEVARARATHRLDGVSSLRVEWEGKP